MPPKTRIGIPQWLLFESVFFFYSCSEFNCERVTVVFFIVVCGKTKSEPKRQHIGMVASMKNRTVVCYYKTRWHNPVHPHPRSWRADILLWLCRVAPDVGPKQALELSGWLYCHNTEHACQKVKHSSVLWPFQILLQVHIKLIIKWLFDKCKKKLTEIGHTLSWNS